MVCACEASMSQLLLLVCVCMLLDFLVFCEVVRVVDSVSRCVRRRPAFFDDVVPQPSAVTRIIFSCFLLCFTLDCFSFDEREIT